MIHVHLPMIDILVFRLVLLFFTNWLWWHHFNDHTLEPKMKARKDHLWRHALHSVCTLFVLQ